MKIWLSKSKKKYNEMVDFVNDMNKRIETLEEENKQLKACHKKIKVAGCWYKYQHEDAFVNTDNIDNITLQELASYIIDHKPIERKENIEITKKYF